MLKNIVTCSNEILYFYVFCEQCSNFLFHLRISTCVGFIFWILNVVNLHSVM